MGGSGVPSVRAVPLRPRPDGDRAAGRISGLLVPAGGWVLPPEPDEPAVVVEEPSWSDAPRPPGRHAERWRLDPGRGGAVALVVVALVAALAASLVVLRGRPQEVPLPAVGVEAAGVPLPGGSPVAEVSGEVVVSVGGLVRAPGLVRLPAGSRVDDAVRAAGGPLDGADVSLLNLARRLVDGELVLVGVAPPPGSAAAPAASGGLLDLNTATTGDLEDLPGIGPVLAQRIVDWRTEHGRFGSVDQLREVKGIGEAVFADLEAEVTV